MRKIFLITLSFFGFSLATYGFSVYSENFDSYTNEGNAGTADMKFYKHIYSAANTVGTIDKTVVDQWGANGPGGASAIVDVDNGGLALKVWTDTGWMPDFDNNQSQRSLQFKDITVTQAILDAGTINASVDYLVGDPFNNVTAQAGAFLKVLDVDSSYAEIGFSQVNYDGASSGWQSASLSISLSNTVAVGDILQFGLFAEAMMDGETVAQNGTWSDNISVTAVPEPSTYALILGLASFLFLAIRRRK